MLTVFIYELLHLTTTFFNFCPILLGTRLCVARLLQANWGRGGKQQHRQISPNHVQAICGLSVLFLYSKGVDPHINTGMDHSIIPRASEHEVTKLRSLVCSRQENTIFLLIFTEPGNSTLAHPCTEAIHWRPLINWRFCLAKIVRIRGLFMIVRLSKYGPYGMGEM